MSNDGRCPVSSAWRRTTFSKLASLVMDKPPLDTLVPQRRGERKMACDIVDREGESPAPMEPRLGEARTTMSAYVLKQGDGAILTAQGGGHRTGPAEHERP